MRFCPDGTRLCAVKAGRVFRTSCVGTASENDSCIIVDNIKTLIDLRSDKEYTKDSEKYDTTVWDNYEDIIYTVKKGKRGRTKVLTPTKEDMESLPRVRHMLSVIDESIYKRGVFKRMNPGKKIKAAVYFAASYTRARKYFIDYINRAGLPLLNELILDYGGPSIKACLEVVSPMPRARRAPIREHLHHPGVYTNKALTLSGSDGRSEKSPGGLLLHGRKRPNRLDRYARLVGFGG